MGGCAEQLITEHLTGYQQLADAEYDSINNNILTVEHAVHEPQQLRLKFNHAEQQQ